MKKVVTRREFMKVAGVSAGALGAWAFLPGSRVFASAAKYGGHFKPASVGYPVIHSLDPSQAGLICESQTIWCMYNGLVRFDSDMNIVPDLARSWTMPDETTYRFKLYPGIRFHDGSACTADDVVFSLDRVRDEKTGSPHRGKLKEVDQIRAVDKETVEITTKRPFAPMLAYLCNARTGTQIVSRNAVKKYGADFGKNPVGTGPYKLVSWKPGEKLEYQKHDQYFMKGMPYVDKMTQLLISEESTATNALMGGDVDFISSVLFSDIKALEEAKGITVMKQPGLNTRFTMLNCKSKPFDDVNVRRAFAHSFDKQNLIDAVIYGNGVIANGIIPPALRWAYHANLKGQTFDPEKAKAFLAKSKYKKEDLAFSILTFGTGWWKRWAEIIGAQANEVLGIPVKVEVLESGTVATRLQEGNFHSAVWGWRGLVEPDEYAFENFHSTGLKNHSGYSNPEVDQLVERARTTMDQKERVTCYHKAEEILADESPYIFCFSNMEHNALRDYVKGFVQLPFNAFGQQFDRVWLAS